MTIFTCIILSFTFSYVTLCRHLNLIHIQVGFKLDSTESCKSLKGSFLLDAHLAARLPTALGGQTSGASLLSYHNYCTNSRLSLNTHNRRRWIQFLLIEMWNSILSQQSVFWKFTLSPPLPSHQGTHSRWVQIGLIIWPIIVPHLWLSVSNVRRSL